MSDDITQGKVYLGYDASGLFKIGITKDAKKRYHQFKTGNPTFQMLFSVPVDNPAVTELEIHTKFERRRIRGEWFSLSADDLIWLYDKFLNGAYAHDVLRQIWDGICNQKMAGDLDYLRFADGEETWR